MSILNKKLFESNKGLSATIVGSILALVTAIGWFFDSNIRAFGGGPAPLSGVSFIDNQSRVKLVDLRGKWRFSEGDDERWSGRDFDDADWDTIKVNENASKRPLYLLLGQIDDVDEVYVNGSHIGTTGSFPPDFASAWNLDRVYLIPPGLLEADRENVIAVRVYDALLGGGIFSGTVGLYTSDLPQPLVNLGGLWKLQPGDDPSWKDEAIDEIGFRPVVVPSYWEHLGFESLDGYAWYRKSFELNKRPQNETMVLLLGKVDDVDETYLNGTKIGSTGVEDDSEPSADDAWSHRRTYTFPSSLLKKSNTLAVRVYDRRQTGGIYEGPVGIMTEADHDLYWKMVESNRKKVIKPIVDWLLGRS
jgi:sialate O-acetylesterase